MKQVFIATHNSGKFERFRNLLKQARPDIELRTPADAGIEDPKTPENGETLADNAEIKARTYFGKVAMPILSNDTGFYVEGEGFVDAPKRKALGETDEYTLTKEEIAEKLISFWKGVATKHGGKVDAAWVEAFVVLNPDGTVERAESRREVILTDTEFGKAHIQMPVRALYISKTTNKPAVQHTEHEEIMEMKPVIDALTQVLKNI
jgi:inosine/xanthosine triphosphate pyrophosphatase family protein